jgi:hypothetical protein
MTKLATFQVTQNVIVTYKRWAGVLRGLSMRDNMRAKQQQNHKVYCCSPGHPFLVPWWLNFLRKKEPEFT